MSGLIELFWRPQPKDVPSGLIAQGRYFQLSFNTANAASVQVAIAACPPNTLRVITHINFRVTPGAATSIVRYSLTFLLGGNAASTYFEVAKNPPVGFVAATRLDDFVAMGDGIWMRPGDTMLLTGEFTSAVNPNQVLGYVYGFEFPVGNTL